eukprot:SAG11_NODE_2312_length_3537_cov_11.743455_3_plen_266_part_00
MPHVSQNFSRPNVWTVNALPLVLTVTWCAGYSTHFPRMIRGWRVGLQLPNVPLVYVELCRVMGQEDSLTNNFWAAQRAATALPAVGYAVTTDIERATHPPDKQDVATRLALELRRVAYGEDIVSRGPELISVTSHAAASSLTLLFSNASLSSRAGVLVGNETACGKSGDGLASDPVTKRPLVWSISKDAVTVQCSSPNGLGTYHTSVRHRNAVAYLQAGRVAHLRCRCAQCGSIRTTRRAFYSDQLACRRHPCCLYATERTRNPS